MAAEPAFASTPRLGVAFVSSAVAVRDGSGSLALVLRGATTGTRVEGMRITAVNSTSLGVIRTFIFDGNSYQLFRESLVTSNAPGTSQAVFSEVSSFDPVLTLPNSNYGIYAATHVAEGFNIFAFGADF